MGKIYNLAVTGHRPNKISSDLYNVNSDLSKKYIGFFKSYITNLSTELGDTVTINCISGVALGIDTLFAIAAIQLRDSGLPITLTTAIPCSNHSSKWRGESVRVYNKILSLADKLTMVSNEPYNSQCMQQRNIYMVDQCDRLLAVWDGTPGGTGNCVRYAESVNKQIDRVIPDKGE